MIVLGCPSLFFPGGEGGIFNNISYGKAPHGSCKIQNDVKGRPWHMLQNTPWTVECNALWHDTVESCLHYAFSQDKFGCVTLQNTPWLMESTRSLCRLPFWISQGPWEWDWKPKKLCNLSLLCNVFWNRHAFLCHAWEECVTSPKSVFVGGLGCCK